ncbi:MAG TPA: nucleotide-binding protein [Methanoregulaceae archaeon]|nr:nucleotide-binding protein [Methanoregulaceae archaeon]
MKMDFSEITERISQKIVSKGHTVDQSRIEGKLRRLVEEFGVPPSEAERTVTNEFFREFGISGVTVNTGDQKEINQFSSDEWVTIEGKVVALSSPPSPAIAQTGIFADTSGAIRFVTWTKANAPLMEKGKWYRLESAVVDEFRGVLNLKIHSGTTIKEIDDNKSLIPDYTQINDLKPGVGSVKVKVVQEWDTTHERMLQSGLLGDESGTIKFVIWREEGMEKLDPGQVYSIFYALVDEYNNRLSLNLNTATVVPEEGDIEISSGETSFSGAFVHMAPGSGLIKRCPVEGCNRVLSRQNYCPVHEIQPNFIYDLRIKGWLDDGQNTRELLIQRENVERLTGMTLDQSREIAENNPLGMDEVFLRMRDGILGRYLTCGGREIEHRILVSSCEFTSFDPAILADLLNRAGGEA